MPSLPFRDCLFKRANSVSDIGVPYRFRHFGYIFTSGSTTYSISIHSSYKAGNSTPHISFILPCFYFAARIARSRAACDPHPRRYLNVVTGRRSCGEGWNVYRKRRRSGHQRNRCQKSRCKNSFNCLQFYLSRSVPVQPARVIDSMFRSRLSGYLSVLCRIRKSIRKILL